MAITMFKVIQASLILVGLPIESSYKTSYILVINTNLPPILHCFQVMIDYWSNFRWPERSVSVSLVGVTPCQYRHK